MTHHETPKPNGAMRNILQYWQIILLVGAAIIAFTTLRVKQAYSEDQLVKLSSRVDANEQTASIANSALGAANNAIATQLSQIQTDLSWIKAKYK